MPTIKIKSIKSNAALNEADYKYILDNLNKDLPLMSVNYTPEGVPFSFALYKGNSCISLFVDMHQLEYELERPKCPVDLADKLIEELQHRISLWSKAPTTGHVGYAKGLLDGHITELETLIKYIEDLRK